MRIEQVKKGKERDELFPRPRADPRRALKVRALCQQGDFRRGLACQEVPGREIVFCARKQGASAVGTRQCVCGACFPWPAGHPFGKDSPCWSRTAVGFRFCVSARLIYYFLWWLRGGKGGHWPSEVNALFYIWYIIPLLIGKTRSLSPQFTKDKWRPNISKVVLKWCMLLIKRV